MKIKKFSRKFSRNENLAGGCLGHYPHYPPGAAVEARGGWLVEGLASCCSVVVDTFPCARYIRVPVPGEREGLPKLINFPLIGKDQVSGTFKVLLQKLARVVRVSCAGDVPG